ncbi:MAG: LysM peptidoglycan-binding domain-containing protein [Vampirovibrionales bacterium]|jgi:LysM repeat protein|nr:LysM peptidoglycan-binding domain-containing protein [Vampirovibrionales bacterium]
MATPSVKAPLNENITPSENLGVYLRNESSTPASAQKELDVLWSQTADTQVLSDIKEEHHPLLTFVAGLLTGLILTTLFFWVFNSRPQTPAMDAVSQAVVQETVKDTPKSVTAPQAVEKASPNVVAEPTAEPTADKAVKATMYTVKSGDTLGGIAHKFYGSYSPDYVARLKKANNLKGDALKLDQELVIPPKNY